MTRLLVTGSRDWVDKELLTTQLRQAWADLRHDYPDDPVILVHGDCPTGADRMADQVWTSAGLPVEPHPADWKTLKKAAGHKRNEEMVNLGADLCVAFLLPCSKPEHTDQPTHDSHGTAGCAQLARDAGIIVREVRP